MEVHKTAKVIKEVDITIERYDACDKCNKRIERELYDAFEFNLELKTGTQYPGDGRGYITEVDLCKSCSERLLSLLKKEGYRINIREWEY